MDLHLATTILHHYDSGKENAAPPVKQSGELQTQCDADNTHPCKFMLHLQRCKIVLQAHQQEASLLPQPAASYVLWFLLFQGHHIYWLLPFDYPALTNLFFLPSLASFHLGGSSVLGSSSISTLVLPLKTSLVLCQKLLWCSVRAPQCSAQKLLPPCSCVLVPAWIHQVDIFAGSSTSPRLHFHLMTHSTFFPSPWPIWLISPSLLYFVPVSPCLLIFLFDWRFRSSMLLHYDECIQYYQ